MNRTGSKTVAVNRSPTRESLLDKVSFKRTFRFVPVGTRRAVVVRGAARRKRGLRVWAVAKVGKAIRTERTSRAILALVTFISMLLMVENG